MVMQSQPLCPDPNLFRLSLVSLRPDRIALHLEPIRWSVPCPTCGTPNSRIHSRYQRTPRDLPWTQWPVELVVHSRKFFCDDQLCSQRIFTERFPGVLEQYARQTTRLRHMLVELAYASSAEMASRVSEILGCVTSPDTLINWQRREQFNFPEVQVLGVDEFALRRGQTYATILIDLERRRPIDVIDGRDANPLIEWLQRHPGVKALVRDRLEAYAQAGRIGAPGALQVADRFHLVRNVGDALKSLLRSHRWTIPTSDSNTGVSATIDQPEQSGLNEERRAPPNKQTLWKAVHERRAKGESLRAISRGLSIHRQSVRRYLAARSPPTYGQAASINQTDPACVISQASLEPRLSQCDRTLR